MKNEDRTFELVSAVTRGDDRAVEDLVADYLPRLRAFVRLRMDPALRARESCSDVVQSVCRGLVENLEDFQYQGETKFRAWLFTAALNKVREKHRFHHRERRDVDREIAPPESSESGGGGELLGYYATVTTPSMDVAAREQINRIEACFDKLPDDYREVITLARIVGLPHDEIAERMGKTVGAVRQLLGRALIRLSRELGD